MLVQLVVEGAHAAGAGDGVASVVGGQVVHEVVVATVVVIAVGLEVRVDEVRMLLLLLLLLLLLVVVVMRVVVVRDVVMVR